MLKHYSWCQSITLLKQLILKRSWGYAAWTVSVNHCGFDSTTVYFSSRKIIDSIANNRYDGNILWIHSGFSRKDNKKRLLSRLRSIKTKTQSRPKSIFFVPCLWNCSIQGHLTFSTNQNSNRRTKRLDFFSECTTVKFKSILDLQRLQGTMLPGIQWAKHRIWFCTMLRHCPEEIVKTEDET